MALRARTERTAREGASGSEDGKLKRPPAGSRRSGIPLGGYQESRWRIQGSRYQESRGGDVKLNRPGVSSERGRTE